MTSSQAFAHFHETGGVGSVECGTHDRFVGPVDRRRFSLNGRSRVGSKRCVTGLFSEEVRDSPEEMEGIGWRGVGDERKVLVGNLESEGWQFGC